MENNFLIEGTVHEIMPVQTLGNNFRKQDFVITAPNLNDQDYIRFQCLQDRIHLLKVITIGSQVIVQFSIQGKPYDDTYYNNLDCTNITLVGSPVQQTIDQSEESIPGNDPIRNLIVNKDEDDDLPF
jgi:hypothetical protein